jgi:hypothetical protein
LAPLFQLEEVDHLARPNVKTLPGVTLNHCFVFTGTADEVGVAYRSCYSCAKCESCTADTANCKNKEYTGGCTSHYLTATEARPVLLRQDALCKLLKQKLGVGSNVVIKEGGGELGAFMGREGSIPAQGRAEAMRHVLAQSTGMGSGRGIVRKAGGWNIHASS